jgi:hypothetical protein
MLRRTLLFALCLWMTLLPVACAPIQAPAGFDAPADQSPSAPAVQGESPPASAYSSEVAGYWFKLLVQLARKTPGYTPPVAARTFGYAGVALYEALVSGMPGNQTLAGQLNAMPAMPQPAPGAQLYWPAVANGALAESARLFVPNITPTPLRDINRLEARLAAEMAGRPSGLPPLEGAPVRRPVQEAPLDAATRDAVLQQSAAFGREVARAVHAWSLDDGGHQGYLRNVDPTAAFPSGEGMWQPTPPDFALPLQPHWGDNRTFALADGADCAAPPPPPYSTDPASAFYQQALEVYQTVRNLSDEQREVALFWADDVGVSATPPGHSLSIATQVLEQEHGSLALAAELYARLGIALSDSFVACWKTKYIHNVPRPITFIQQQIDPMWNVPEPTDPLLTPPFPEYTSGHSVEARAAAEILTATFGEDYRFTDITHVDRGLAPRTFPSFYAAAAEAAVSRLYGGIHYRAAIEEGLAQGACIGRRVLALEFRAP